MTDWLPGLFPHFSRFRLPPPGPVGRAAEDEIARTVCSGVLAGQSSLHRDHEYMVPGRRGRSRLTMTLTSLPQFISSPLLLCRGAALCVCKWFFAYLLREKTGQERKRVITVITIFSRL
jgi:hypothetical protein